MKKSRTMKKWGLRIGCLAIATIVLVVLGFSALAEEAAENSEVESSVSVVENSLPQESESEAEGAESVVDSSQIDESSPENSEGTEGEQTGADESQSSPEDGSEAQDASAAESQSGAESQSEAASAASDSEDSSASSASTSASGAAELGEISEKLSGFSLDTPDEADSYLQLSNVSLGTSAAAFETHFRNTTPLSLSGNFLYTDTPPEEGVNVTIVLANNESLKYPGEKYYFESASSLGLPSGVTFTSAVLEGNTLTVVLNFKGNANDNGNFSVNFPFNAEFNGWVPTGTELATVSVSVDNGEIVGDASSMRVTSSTHVDPSFVSFTKTPVGDVALGASVTYKGNLFVDGVDTTEGANPYWRMEPGTDVKLVLQYPAGAVVSGTTVDKSILDGAVVAVPGDDTIEHFVWDLGVVGLDGAMPENDWTDVYSGRRYLAWLGMKIEFPDDAFVENEIIDNMDFYLEFTPYGAGGTQRVSMTYDSFRLVKPDIQMKPNTISVLNYGASPTVDIDVPGKISFQSGYMGIQNNGGVAIPETVLTWYNDTEKPARINHMTLHNQGALYKSMVVVTYSGGTQETVYLAANSSLGNFSLLEFWNLSMPEAEYVTKVEIYPLNNVSLTALNNGSEEPVCELIKDAGMVVKVYFGSWTDGKFPVAETPEIQNGDCSNTWATVSWKGETKPEAHTSPALDNPDGVDGVYTITIAGDSKQKVYYGKETPFPTVLYWILPTDPLAPGESFNAELFFYNNPASGSSAWKNPMLLLIPPEVVDIDVDAELTIVRHSTGATVSTARIEKVEINERDVYRIIPNDPTFEVKLAQRGDADNFRVVVPFTVKEGTAPGTYTLAGKSSQEGTANNLGYLFGTTQGTGNNIVVRDELLASKSERFFDDSDTDWDNNPATTWLYSDIADYSRIGEIATIEVKEVKDVKVSATLKDSETNTWMPVEQADAKATVPLEGTGSIRLEVSNAGNTYLGDMTLLNILPRTEHDFTAKDPVSAKGSEWDATLAGLTVKVYDADGNEDKSFSSSEYTLKYDENNNPQYSGSFERAGSGEFGDALTTDMAKAGSFELKFTNGYRLAPGYKLSIEVTVKAPASATIDQIDKEAYNAYAIIANHYQRPTGGNPLASTPVLEPKKQTFVLKDKPGGVIESLKGSGIVFKDYNINGVYESSTEAAYIGATVQLYHWDTVNDKPDVDGGVVATTTTNAVGGYRFEGLYGGSYAIKVLLPTEFLSLSTGRIWKQVKPMAATVASPTLSCRIMT